MGFAGRLVLDPQNSFGRTSVGESLVDVAIALEVPDFVVTLLPTAAPIGGDGDGFGERIGG